MSEFEFDEQLEFQIVKNITASRTFLMAVIEYLQPDYFKNVACKICVKIIKQYFSKYSDVPTFSIIKLESKEILTPRDDIELFNKNLKEIEKIEFKNEDYLRTKVLEFCKTQALIIAVRDSIDLIKKKDYSKIEEKVRKAISITENTDVGLKYFEEIQARLVSEMKYKNLIKTGLSSLDRALKGGWSLEDTTLSIIVAPTGVGKSLFLCKFAANAILAGKKAVYITHELSTQRAAARFDSIFTKITQDDRLKNHEELAKKLNFIKGVCGSNLIIKEFHTKTCSTNMIANYLNKLKNTGYTPDVVFNDYLDIMIPNNVRISSDESYVTQKAISEELRALAQDFGCPIITASQTNRAGSDKEVIKNSDVAESYGKTFTADLIMTINQSEKDRVLGACKLYIAKFRNGPSGFQIPMTIDYQRMDVQEFVMQQDDKDE